MNRYNEEQGIDIIAILNYLWGLSIGMANTLEYTEEDLDGIGTLFGRIEDYIKGTLQ